MSDAKVSASTAGKGKPTKSNDMSVLFGAKGEKAAVGQKRKLPANAKKSESKKPRVSPTSKTGTTPKKAAPKQTKPRKTTSAVSKVEDASTATPDVSGDERTEEEEQQVTRLMSKTERSARATKIGTQLAAQFKNLMYEKDGRVILARLSALEKTLGPLNGKPVRRKSEDSMNPAEYLTKNFGNDKRASVAIQRLITEAKGKAADALKEWVSDQAATAGGGACSDSSFATDNQAFTHGVAAVVNEILKQFNELEGAFFDAIGAQMLPFLANSITSAITHDPQVRGALSEFMSNYDDVSPDSPTAEDRAFIEDGEDEEDDEDGDYEEGDPIPAVFSSRAASKRRKTNAAAFDASEGESDAEPSGDEDNEEQESGDEDGEQEDGDEDGEQGDKDEEQGDEEEQGESDNEDAEVEEASQLPNDEA